MSDAIKQAQAAIPSLDVANMVLEFFHEFGGQYGYDKFVLPGVGPMQSFLGWAIQKGYLILPKPMDEPNPGHPTANELAQGDGCPLQVTVMGDAVKFMCSYTDEPCRPGDFCSGYCWAAGRALGVADRMQDEKSSLKHLIKKLFR